MSDQDAGKFKASAELDEALGVLSSKLLALGLIPPSVGFRGFFRLSQQCRLILAFLDREERASHSTDLPLPAEVPEPQTTSVQAVSAEASSPQAKEANMPPELQSSAVEGETQPATQTAAINEPQPLIPPHIEGSSVAFQFQEFRAPTSKNLPPADAAARPALQSQAAVGSVAPSKLAQKLTSAAAPASPASTLQPSGVPVMPAQVATQRKSTVPTESVKKIIHLKNSRVDQPYSGAIEVDGIRDLQLLDDAQTGLRLNQETGTLIGTVSASGDFVLRLQGMLGVCLCHVSAHLAVIPDPRSLWVSKDCDPEAPFWKPDEDSGRSSGDLLCVAASKRGRSHAQGGTFRDDDFALWTGGTGRWNIAVVADGAGSAKFSRRGSQVAVSTIMNDLPWLLDEHMSPHVDQLTSDLRSGVEGTDQRVRGQLYRTLGAAAFNAAKAISDEADALQERDSAFSTTIVLSVAHKGPFGWFIAGFSIGDGGAAIFDLPSRTVVPLTLADSGEFAGQTRFLQKSEFSGGFDDVSKRLFYAVRDDFTAILAMTDGVTDPKFPTDSAFIDPQTWVDFWEKDLCQEVSLSRDNPDIERELLAWLDFWSPGNHDDRTLAIMLPIGG